MPGRRRSLVGLAALVTAGALVAGACGGDDDDADDSRRAEAPDEAAAPGSGATDTTGATGATTTTAAGATDDGAGGSPVDAGTADDIGAMDFCDGFRAAIRLDSATALAGVRQLEAPAEITDDWQVFLDFAETSMSGEPMAATPEEVEAAGAAAEEATGNVLDYVGRECGYSVDMVTGEVSEDGGG
jgi:hypothetical protein